MGVNSLTVFIIVIALDIINPTLALPLIRGGDLWFWRRAVESKSCATPAQTDNPSIRLANDADRRHGLLSKFFPPFQRRRDLDL